MWKTVCSRIRFVGEISANFNNLRSNFSTSGPCIGKTTTDDDPFKSPVRKYNTGRYVNRLDARSDAVKPKLRGTVEFPIVFRYTTQQRRQQSGSFEWEPFYKCTAGFLTSICVGQLICLYSRRRRIANGWQQIDRALEERRIRKLISGEDESFAKSEYQKSYVPLHDNVDDVSTSVGRPWAFPVSNDHGVAKRVHTSSTSTQTLKTQNVDAAVDEFMKTFGHNEFKLAIANLAANRIDLAVPHFKSATVHRHPEATFNLGVCYDLGCGVDKNKKIAMECYRAAASLGHKKAMFNLGVFYARGYGGLTKNKDAAKACIEAAYELGLEDAKEVLRAKQHRQLAIDTSTMKSPHSAHVDLVTQRL